MKSALILCGGKSSRFGGKNKAFFPFDHRCFLEKILDELNDFDVFLSVDDPKVYQKFPQQALVDPISIGPLGGLREGLKHMKGDWIFVASCDIPRITADFIRYLEEFCIDGLQAIVPKDRQGQFHPLCGFYHKSVLELVESQIQKDKLKLHDLLSICQLKTVDLNFTIFKDTLLQNINTDDDLQKLHRPKIFAVCGVKNSGKTTLITKIIPVLCNKNLTVAVIKHTSHDHPFDREESDTYLHKKSGAKAVCIYSPQKKMVIQDSDKTAIADLIEDFSDYDVILLEGFKESSFPKIEIIRKGISSEIVSERGNLQAIVTDIEHISYHHKIGLEDIESIVQLILKEI